MMSAGYLWRPPPLLLLLLLMVMAAAAEKKEPLVPALFVFGDSLVDNGNNNGLPSLAKANYLPYGVDFGPAGGEGSPTGRFCNGYTIVDYLAELLGLPLVPPYSQLLSSGSVPTNGANYASAAAGILDDSGANFAGRIPFDEQISNFERTVAAMGAAGSSTNLVVGRSMVFVGMGSNDYLNNYLMPNYDTRRHHTPAQFADLLLSRYAAQLTRLYRAGARRFVVAGLGSLGCIPTILARTTEGRCDEPVDRDLVAPFNAGVKAMLDRLNDDDDDGELPGARFAFLDNYRIVRLMLADPAAYGFSVVDRGCCGVGLNAGQMTCLPFMEPCADRGRYLFWDAYHPTAAVNEVIARAAFDGGDDVVFPVNVRRLAQL